MPNAEVELTRRMRRIEEKWHRLIPSRFPPVDVFERLGSAELGARAKELEIKSNPRLREKTALQGSHPDMGDGTPQLQNWNHAPFAYTNPEGSTFLHAGYRVLELVQGIRPALAFALRRREIFLERTQEPPFGLDMRLLVTPVAGNFVDLCDAPFEFDEIKRREFGGQLYDDGVQGILFRHPEHRAAQALVVFDQAVLGRTVQSAHYRFVWDGKAISKIYEFANGQEITRADLLAESEGLASV